MTDLETLLHKLGTDKMLETLILQRIAVWRERARRIRPNEEMRVSLEKRERTSEYIWLVNRAAELEADVEAARAAVRDTPQPVKERERCFYMRAARCYELHPIDPEQWCRSCGDEMTRRGVPPAPQGVGGAENYQDNLKRRIEAAKLLAGRDTPPPPPQDGTK